MGVLRSVGSALITLYLRQQHIMAYCPEKWAESYFQTPTHPPQNALPGLHVQCLRETRSTRNPRTLACSLHATKNLTNIPQWPKPMAFYSAHKVLTLQHAWPSRFIPVSLHLFFEPYSPYSVPQTDAQAIAGHSLTRHRFVLPPGLCPVHSSYPNNLSPR